MGGGIEIEVEAKLVDEVQNSVLAVYSILVAMVAVSLVFEPWFVGKLQSDDTGEMDDSWAQGLYLWLFPGEKALSVSNALDCIDVLTVRYRLFEVEEIVAGMLVFGYVSKTSGAEYKDLEGRFEFFDMEGNF